MATIQTLERLMEDERHAMESHRRELDHIDDTDQRELFTRLAELRAQAIVALQSYVSSARPIAEVTRQINEMF